MFRNQIMLTGIVLHDPRPSDSPYPPSLSTHISLILPENAFPVSREMKSHSKRVRVAV